MYLRNLVNRGETYGIIFWWRYKLSTTHILIGVGVAVAIWITSYMLGYASGKSSEQARISKIKETGKIGTNVDLRGKKEVKLYKDEKLKDFSRNLPVGLTTLIVGRFKYELDVDKYDAFEIEGRCRGNLYKGWVSSRAVYDEKL